MTQYRWRSARIVWETTDTATIIFNTGTDPFIYLSGQFVNLSLLINGEYYTRSYSLSSTYGVNPQPWVTIKRVAGGVFSNYVLDNVHVIKEWSVEGPFGNFIISQEHSSAKHIVLLAGGSGITPIFSIAQFVLHQLIESRITLIYSNRTADTIIFRDTIEQWTRVYADRLQVTFALSQPLTHEKELPAPFLPLRLNKLITKKLLKQTAGKSVAQTLYFICGPEALMQQHVKVLEDLNIPSANILREWFQPPAVKEPIMLPTQPLEVQLYFYEQTSLLEVQPGRTILDAALQERVPLRYSCKKGTCWTCTATVLSGKVAMSANYALTQQQVDERKVLLCQAYPLDNEVTVEIM